MNKDYIIIIIIKNNHFVLRIGLLVAVLLTIF